MSGTDRPGDSVYNRIALLRAEQGVTRRQLSDALGVHYQTVGYLERGEYNPSLHLALRIAEFFGLPVETIFSTVPFPRISDLRGSDSGGAHPAPPGRTA
ncbi:helix-turn-helix transcriptional regulator [Blastococcus sp. CT_GayMR16]|uniref:helix-turn-helix transcriptional regulator n=1 Tax=Blastococcus sp. CT_GayMR16 TaxID=2559607 RepID=UPI0010742D4E|nr:helix-turn-helix transcriptional regulator [Blastococcus sp. CT_GayMR16]TFV90512.1 transcriptional regulator [Blastococcus sp. CT_GayMR16]